MKKINIIQESKEFDNIIHSGRYIKNNYYIIYYKDKEKEYHRFGLSVGQKISKKAVVRNKLKRRLKSIIDNNKNCYPKTKDYIIIMKGRCALASYEELEQNFLNIINQVKGENNEKR